jgi:cytochrome d ubiquinol oxidase subunit I
MAFAGPIFGMPFSLEGFAFFLEAIFLGLYLYGWERLSPWTHWAAGVIVALSGTVSGIFVVFANAWMNTPVGFEMQGARVVRIDPLAAMANPAAFTESLHMTLAAFAAVGFAVAAIHATCCARTPRTSSIAGPASALTVGGAAAMLQTVSGDLSAQHVARYQPVKLAAMEAFTSRERGARRPRGLARQEEERTRGPSRSHAP